MTGFGRNHSFRMHLGWILSTNSVASRSVGRGSCSSSAGGAGARLQDFLNRMDENSRVGFERRFRLLHLSPHDSARMQRHRQNKCCDDCPFVRRFVNRCGWHNALSLRLVSLWRSPYPDYVSVLRQVGTLQCCSLHINFWRRVDAPAIVTLRILLDSNKTLIRSNA
jgi:hypothetical protein